MARSNNNGKRRRPQQHQQRGDPHAQRGQYVAAPAKRQRLDGGHHQQQQRQQQLQQIGRAPPIDPHTQKKTTLGIALEERDYEVLVYKKPTRAVIGPGFVVRQLVVDHEKGVRAFSGLDGHLDGDGIDTISMIVSAKCPQVITHKTLVGVVSMTWETEVPAGGADVAGSLIASLQASGIPYNTIKCSEDLLAMRAEVHVICTDLDHVEEVAALAFRLSLTTKPPVGASIHTAVAFEFRAMIALDIFKVFVVAIRNVRLYARSEGMVWHNDEVQNNMTHVNVSLRSSSRDDVERVMAMLDACIESEAFADPILRRTYRRKKDWNTLMRELCLGSRTDDTTRLRHSQHNRLIWIYGDEPSRRAAIRALKMKSLGLLHEARVERGEKAVCCVCTNEATDLSMELSVCGHHCCVDCIKPGLTTTNPLPLCCPAANCGRPIGVFDVLYVAEDIDALLNLAVLDDVAKHEQTRVICPLPGCTQVLPRPTGDGAALACGSCSGVYCLACSNAHNSAILHHEGVTCTEASLLTVDRHVEHIRSRILNLNCERCGTAFFDDDGCLAVACANVSCRRELCVCCLELSHTDYRTTRDHVKNCSKNPRPGSLMAPHRGAHPDSS